MASDLLSELVEKAEAALIAAIEVYNKPDFRYREESFSILCVNAWELLLKARLLDENKGDQACLYEYQDEKGKDGAIRFFSPVLTMATADAARPSTIATLAQATLL